MAAVSASYFDLFDAAPVRGRFFGADEDMIPRGVDVVVLEAHEPGWGASGRNGGQVVAAGDRACLDAALVALKRSAL